VARFTVLRALLVAARICDSAALMPLTKLLTGKLDCEVFIPFGAVALLAELKLEPLNPLPGLLDVPFGPE
jgi:hypothetical protein